MATAERKKKNPLQAIRINTQTHYPLSQSTATFTPNLIQKYNKYIQKSSVGSAAPTPSPWPWPSAFVKGPNNNSERNTRHLTKQLS